MLATPIFALTVASLCVATPVEPTKTRSASDVKYIFSFGDSYSQTGFNVSLTLPSAADGNILGNPAFPGWTTTGGYNYLDHLSATYNTSLTLNYNFASGGATVDATLVTPFEPYPTVLSLINQTNEFTTLISDNPTFAPWTAQNSLFSIWMGVNDIGNSFYDTTAWPALGNSILDAYFNCVAQMYKAGARNFAFLNVPPIERAPLNLPNSDANRQLESDTIATFNTALSNYASNFERTFHDSTVWIVDTHSAFLVALNDPIAYGAANASCYDADGVTCLWWNNYHPAEAIHRLVAEKVVSTLAGGSNFFGRKRC